MFVANNGLIAGLLTASRVQSGSVFCYQYAEAHAGVFGS